MPFTNPVIYQRRERGPNCTLCHTQNKAGVNWDVLSMKNYKT